MLLKVNKIESRTGFLPMLKTGGEFWQAPKTLYEGESVEVKDFIGYALMAAYPNAFSVIQEDMIKDAVDNQITVDDVAPSKRALKQTKDIKVSQATRQEQALETAAQFSDLAADRIAAAQAIETGDKNALNEKARAQDAKDGAQAKVAQAEKDAIAAKAKADQAKVDAHK